MVLRIRIVMVSGPVGLSVFKLEAFCFCFVFVFSRTGSSSEKEWACDSTNSQQVAILGSAGLSLPHCLADRLASQNKPKSVPDTKTMQNLIICDWRY